MATRKRPEVKSILDNPVVEPDRIVRHLESGQFKSIVRFACTASKDEVLQLRNATFRGLERLNVLRDDSMAVGSTPRGSDQHDIQSIFRWIERIRNTDAVAIDQLITIDATCVARTS